MKKTSFIIIAIIAMAFAAIGAGIFFTKPAFAAYANGRYTKNSCLTGGGYISVVSWSLTRVGDLAGGSLYGGGAWACEKPLDDRAIMFFAGSVTHDGGRYYTIDPDTEVDLTSTYNRTIAMGMVHNQTGSVYAVNIGYCLTSSCSSGKKAGGVVSSFSSSVTRMNSSNQPHDYYGGWTAPYHTSGYAVINGVKLQEKWDSVEKTEIWDNFYRVTLYQYRCWSNNGTSVTGTCSTNPMYLYIRFADNSWETTFSGRVVASSNVTYTNDSTATITFTHQFARDNNGPSDAVTGYWWSSNTNGASWYNSGSPTWAPNTGWQTVNTNSYTANLDYGDNTFCEIMGFYQKITNDGWDSWQTREGCVTVHRYYWYEFDGRVVPKVNSTDKTDGSTTWIDGNTANLQFVHQLQRKTTANVQTRYKTSKNPAINNNFGIQADWGNTSINVNNTWFTQRNSGSPNSADVAKNDSGSTYCQTLNFWRYVRESVNWSDTNTYNTNTEKSACVTLKRYKTTFTGSTTVTVNGTTPTSNEVTITGSSVPTTVPVVFTHKVTRVQEDTPPSAPGDKTSAIAVSTSGTTGCRSGDPCGNSRTSTETRGLPRTGTDDDRTEKYEQTINVKIYPDQTITICQQMTYVYRIWGSDRDTTSPDRVCVTLHMDKATCTDGATSQYGVHDGRNYGSLTIFKNVNDGADISNASGVKDTGNHTITTWAKPGDNINFRHESCAAADLANQFNSKGVTTTYTVAANKAGYLFGKTIGTDPFTGTSATIGTTNATAGTGPFNGGTYTKTYRSPSLNSGTMYACEGGYYDNDHKAKSNYYQITSNVGQTSTLSSGTAKCNSYAKTIPSGSTEYAIGSDVGKKFTQKLEWTDLWIAGDTVNTSHNGRNKASITGEVNVPYNYYIHPYASVGNGNITQTVTPGSSLHANVYVPVMKRENKQVGETYATHTKPTKIQVVSFILREGTPNSSASYLASNNGTIATSLCDIVKGTGTVIRGSCSIQNDKSGNDTINKNYILNASTKNQLDGTGDSESTETGIYSTIATNNSDTVISRSGSFVTEVNVKVPESGTRIGDKICIAVAAWPSDSHNIGLAKTVDNNNQNIALSSNAGSGAKWVVSAPLCTTVAKNPIMSVEGSQLTVAGNVETSRNKYVDRYYDSWVEYGLLAGGTAKNMASGAASAYISAQSLITNGTKYIRGADYANRPTTNAGTKVGSSVCLYTAQTYLSNGACASPGNASTIATAANINNILDRVRDVYTRKTGATYHQEAGIDSFSNLKYVYDSTGTRYTTKMTIGGKNYYDLTPRTTYACGYDEDLGFYTPNAADAQRGEKADGTRIAPFYCLPNGAKYYYVNSNAYIGGRSANYFHNQYVNYVDDLVNPDGQETYRNQTQIFHVKGTLVIDTNFVTDRNYKVAGNNHIVDIFDDIQQIPQIILIADRIYITSRVSRIDAWLIADGTNGTINTCAYDNYNTFVNGQYIKDPGSHSILHAKICDRSIMFNGPVFAKNMILNRTAGGGTHVLSEFEAYEQSLDVVQEYYSQRGEIFNLRSDVYLWGYYQAQRNGILTTVFTQEMPTRY